MASAICTAIVFLFFWGPYTMTPNIMWEELKSTVTVTLTVLLSSFAFIYLLPVLVRGRAKQRLFAVILAVFAGYYAHQAWEIFIYNYVINS